MQCMYLCLCIYVYVSICHMPCSFILVYWQVLAQKSCWASPPFCQVCFQVLWKNQGNGICLWVSSHLWPPNASFPICWRTTPSLGRGKPVWIAVDWIEVADILDARGLPVSTRFVTPQCWCPVKVKADVRGYILPMLVPLRPLVHARKWLSGIEPWAFWSAAVVMIFMASVQLPVRVEMWQAVAIFW